ncbi:MAG: outer membrane beta-barrel protein [Candidatus Eisenbacteria bacterium]
MKAAIGLGVVAALCVLPSSGRAEDPIGRISLGGSAGLSTYGLADVNDRIADAGNRFLEVDHLPPLKGLETIDIGWTFWSDVKIAVPFLSSFFISGGYGVSSGGVDSPDMDNKIEVSASQKAMHVRLLYTPPFRIQEDTRLFVGGGPLIITEQKVRATQMNRSNMDEPWTEEIVYKADGIGWTFGLGAEYMVQDRMTLALDLGYRLADLKYSSWSAWENVKLTLPETAVQNEVDRLHYEDSYPGHAFLDWEATVANGAADEYATQYGPHREQLVPLTPEDLRLDLSGFQIQLGLRFYFL